MGLTNVEIMVPFVRTVQRGRAGHRACSRKTAWSAARNGLRVIMMCEIPSNAILADQFLQHFDGFSIGSNDMTQLTLGLDRDSGIVAGQFDERDPAVKVDAAAWRFRPAARPANMSASADRDLPIIRIWREWLMEQGIDAISLNPDTVVETWLFAGQTCRRASAAAA